MLGFTQWNAPASCLKLHQHVMHDPATMPMLQPVRSPPLSPHFYYQMNCWLRNWMTSPLGLHLLCCIFSGHTTGGPTPLQWHILTTTYCYTEPQPHFYCACYFVFITRMFVQLSPTTYDYWVASESATAMVTWYSLPASGCAKNSRMCYICHDCSTITSTLVLHVPYQRADI